VFFIELMRLCYILGFCNVMVLLGSLSSLGGRLAVNLAVLSALPMLATATTLHCLIRDSRRLLLMPLLATSLLGYGCIYNIVGVTPIPILAHIPGLLLLSVFFGAVCQGTRRIVNLVLTMLLCLCVAGNAVFSMAEDRGFMVVSLSCILGLLFAQSSIGNVYCSSGCAPLCASSCALFSLSTNSDILKSIKTDL
jgi:hypothetical protein